jgi:hypothetical protein
MDKLGDEAIDFLPKSLLGILVMMQVYFNLPKPPSTQITQRAEMFLTVFFLWVKETVFGDLTIRILMPSRQGWILLAPTGHTRSFDLQVRALPTGFVMVHKAEHDVYRTVMFLPFPQGTTNVIRQPKEYVLAVQLDREEDHYASSSDQEYEYCYVQHGGTLPIIESEAVNRRGDS